MEHPPPFEIAKAVDVLRRIGAVNEVALFHWISTTFPNSRTAGSDDDFRSRPLRRLFQDEYYSAYRSFITQFLALADDTDKAVFIAPPPGAADSYGPIHSLRDSVAMLTEGENKPTRRRDGEIARAIQASLAKYKGRRRPKGWTAIIRRELEPRFGRVATSHICQTSKRMRSRPRKRQVSP